MKKSDSNVEFDIEKTWYFDYYGLCNSWSFRDLSFLIIRSQAPTGMLRHRINHWPLGAIYLVPLSNKLGRVCLEKRFKTPVAVKN